MNTTSSGDGANEDESLIYSLHIQIQLHGAAAVSEILIFGGVACSKYHSSDFPLASRLFIFRFVFNSWLQPYTVDIPMYYV